MAPKKSEISFASLKKDIIGKKFCSTYLLEGEEPYFIDQLSKLIVDNALTEDEKDFNLTVTYGIDADLKAIANQCNRFPVMAQRQVVLIKEAQNIGKGNSSKSLDLLIPYVEKPLDSTILIICNKGGVVRADSKFVKTLSKIDSAAIFNSKKIASWNLTKVISDYIQSSGCSADDKSKGMLAEFIGDDLARLFGEIDKLVMLADASRRITPEQIERNIGISKDYNYWEFEDAIQTKNAGKAYRIIDYYKKNQKGQKKDVVIMNVAQLFSFFSNVLLVKGCPDKSREGLTAYLGGNVRPNRLEKFIATANRYSLGGCINIIGHIRNCDGKLKGIGGNASQNGFELLKELVFQIMHS